MIVEARTAGQDDWTTLPDLNGGTTETPPAECTGNGFLLQRLMVDPSRRGFAAVDEGERRLGIGNEHRAGQDRPRRGAGS